MVVELVAFAHWHGGIHGERGMEGYTVEGALSGGARPSADSCTLASLGCKLALAELLHRVSPSHHNISPLFSSSRLESRLQCRTSTTPCVVLPMVRKVQYILSPNLLVFSLLSKDKRALCISDHETGLLQSTFMSWPSPDTGNISISSRGSACSFSRQPLTACLD